MGTLDIAIVVQIVVFGVAFLGTYYGLYNRITNRVTAIETRCDYNCDFLPKLVEDVGELRNDIKKLQTESEVFWKVLEPHLGRTIHSPKAKDRDALVDELIAGTLSPEDAQRLADLLMKAIRGSDWTPEKKLAGTLLLARVQSTMIWRGDKWEQKVE